MNKPLLVDVSHWQTKQGSEYGFNFAKAKSAGAVGALIRAGSVTKTGGELYMDYDLMPNVQLTNQMEEFPRWFYWYMRPKHGGKRQAMKFLEYIDEAGAGDEWVGLVGDFEESQLGVIDTASQWDQFMEVLRYHYPNKKHMVYTRGWFWNTYAKYTPWANFYDLWISIYPTSMLLYKHPWQNLKYKPHTWDDWKLWQWTDKGNGSKYGAESKQIDLNYFNGTIDDFREYTGLVQTPPQQKPVVQILKPAGVDIQIVEV